MAPLLQVDNIEVYYGVIKALKGVSFEVNKGEIVALIGANGAGKTTILHTVTGLLKPKTGKIIFKDDDITKIPAHKIVTMGMAHVPEGRRIFSQLSVLDNIILNICIFYKTYLQFLFTSKCQYRILLRCLF